VKRLPPTDAKVSTLPTGSSDTPPDAGVSGRVQTSAIASTPVGRLMRKTLRQPKAEVSSPPSGGPRLMPKPIMLWL